MVLPAPYTVVINIIVIALEFYFLLFCSKQVSSDDWQHTDMATWREMEPFLELTNLKTSITSFLVIEVDGIW